MKVDLVWYFWRAGNQLRCELGANPHELKRYLEVGDADEDVVLQWNWYTRDWYGCQIQYASAFLYYTPIIPRP